MIFNFFIRGKKAVETILASLLDLLFLSIIINWACSAFLYRPQSMTGC